MPSTQLHKQDKGRAKSIQQVIRLQISSETKCTPRCGAVDAAAGWLRAAWLSFFLAQQDPDAAGAEALAAELARGASGCAGVDGALQRYARRGAYLLDLGTRAPLCSPGAQAVLRHIAAPARSAAMPSPEAAAELLACLRRSPWAWPLPEAVGRVSTNCFDGDFGHGSTWSGA